MSLALLQSSAKAPEKNALLGLTARPVVLAIILTVAIYLGITRLGFIQINWVPYVVPPVPALLFLLILQGCNLLLGRVKERLPQWLQPLSRGELLLIYAGLCVALCMERGGYVIHYLLTAKYFATPINGWEKFFDYYPDYYIIKDPRLINQWFEGAPDGRIPWDAWRPVLTFWGSFSLCLITAMMCLAGFFRRQWTEAERLTYPLLFLPIEMTGGSGKKSYAVGFLKNPLMWVGFGLATAFNVLNIVHAFVPTIPGIRMSIPLDDKFTDPPLRYLMPLNLSMSLEVWGLAYLVSGEVLLSTWVFYFLVKLVKLIGLSAGYRAGGFPFAQEMSGGGCLAIVTFMLYVSRPHFQKVWQDIVRGPNPDDRNEALPYRYLAIGFVASTVAMMAMLNYAGIALPLLLVYFAALYMFVLVAARVRAEVGPPVVWTHPYGYDQTMPVHLLGTRNIMHLAGPQGTVLFYSLFYIGRTVFAHTTAQAFTDGLRLADTGHVSRRSINALMVITCVLALGITFWFHLNVGYQYGQGMIGAKVGRAGTGWGMQWSKGNYSLLEAAFTKPGGPDWTRIAFYGAGFLFTAAVTVARTQLASFPFHPLGFVMATLYGDWSPYWWPFLVAWAAQRLALHYGSLPAYRKFVPLFLGLTLGHMLVGGVIWRIIINYFIDPTISIRYYLNLGG